MNVIAYVRVSTEGQEDKYGLDVQKQAIQKYCDDNGYTINAWYEDVMSGANAKRPQLSNALHDESKPQALIVYKKDRLARKMEDFYYFKFKFKARGMDLISVTDPNGDSVMEKVYEAISIAWAEQERQIITMRTSAGRLQKAKTGGYCGGAVPLGYKTINGKLEIEPKDAEIIKEIFKLKKEGISTNKITTILNERNILTRKGKPYQTCTVRKIISNKDFYKGMYNYGGVKGKGTHEPILSEED